MFKKDLRIVGCLVGLLWSCLAGSTTVFETTELVGATAQSDAALPEPVQLTIASAGDYTITLTDLATPAALGTLRAIVTRELTGVAEVEVNAAVASSATQTFTATPGDYRILVLGVADAGSAGGFAVTVAPAGGGTAVLEHVDVVEGAPAPNSDQSALQASFDIAQNGSYRLLFTDIEFPQPLDEVNTLLLQETPSGPVVVPVVGNAFTATAGTYQLLIFATANADSQAGLYSVRVDSGAGTSAIYQSTQSVGNVSGGIDASIVTAGTHTLTLSDAAFPAALTSVAAVLIQNGIRLGRLDAAGSVDVTAEQGTARIYTRATPNTSEGVGAFGVRLDRGGQTVFADIVLADASDDAATSAIYSVASTAGAGGSYRLEVKDFAFPSSLASLRSGITQGSAMLGTLNGATSGQFNLQPGPFKVLVAVRPPAGAAPSALFGLTVTPSAGGAPLLETTQGVGGFFRIHPVPIGTTGQYDLTLQDFAFPATMPTAALAITRGTSLVAQVYGSGTASKQQLTAGTYVFNFIGVPAASAKYGAYGIGVADSPPAPAITFTANPASVASGQASTLQWTVTGATACTASNGWSGTKSATGTQSQSTGPLNANTTFGLSCSGPGGTSSASVTVNVTSPSASGRRGGGGAMDAWLLVALCILVATRAVGQPRPPTCNR